MKQITLIAVLFAFSLSSWGQARMQLAFTASPSINWLSTSSPDVNSKKSVAGYDFGISGDIFFSENEHYSLLTGLQIINTGGKMGYRNDFLFSGYNMASGSEIRYRLRYLEVPLSIKLKTNQFHRLYYWGQFGLSSMINISAKGDGDAINGPFRKANINDEVNLFNLAMNVGAGVDFDLGANNSVSAGLIFQNGLTDVTTDDVLTDKTILNSLKIRLALIF